MNHLIDDADRILEDFRALMKREGLEFSPPSDRAHLGSFAFSKDIIERIVLGVTVSLLTQGVKALWTGRGTASPTRKDGVFSDLFRSAEAIQIGVEKLRLQGVDVREAQVALGLLVESIGATLQRLENDSKSLNKSEMR